MTFNAQTLPLPPARYAPIQAAAGTWIDLPADGRETVLRAQITDTSLLDVTGLSGTNADGVSIETAAQSTTGRGTRTDREEVTTTALGGYDQPVSGPQATDQLTIDARNRSATDYTVPGGGVYRLYLNYAVRPPSVREKVVRGLPLTDVEQDLRDAFNLREYDTLGLAPRSDAPAYQPTVDDKTELRERTYTDTVDVSETGDPGVSIIDESVPADRVFYITGIQVNGDAFAPTDDVRLVFERAGPDRFYEFETHGLPAPPFTAPVHLPFFDSCDVRVKAANAVTGVDVRLETVEVARTLTEKALYGLSDEVKANDSRAGDRRAVYNVLRDYIKAGVPIRPNLSQILKDAGARSTSSVTLSPDGVM
jgi:hypothetical protein